MTSIPYSTATTFSATSPSTRATRTIGSSMRLYYENAHSTSAGSAVSKSRPGMAMSSADMFPTPREWVERQYNVIHWTDLPRGGHFLEWEVPADRRRPT